MVRLLALLVLPSLLAACTNTTVGPTDAVFVDEPATVRDVNGGHWFFLEVEDGPLLVPYPERLPAAFRQGGLRVTFSGELLPIPPNVRLPGPPVGITAIRTTDR